ncbi:hypothetical protein PHVU103714_04840 [Phocaeicola vulgatus]|jgi:hypothetical protein
METLNEKQGKHCPNIKKGGMLCSCDFPSYLSFPHGLLEMKRGYSSCPVIFYIQKVNAQS